MSYLSDLQYNAQQNPQQWGTIGAAMFNPALQAYGQSGSPFNQSNLSAFGQNAGWAQPVFASQRQLSQQDIGDVVRQLVPLLPQVLGQAQQGIGYGQGVGYGFGPQQQRLLTQQDVNEVVRQILPILPQVAAMFQGHHAPMAAPAIYGGFGQQQNPWALMHNPQNNPWGQQQPFGAQNPYAQQQLFGQQGWPQTQAAFGATPHWLQSQQRTLTQNDINEVVRQLVGIIPQAIANLQAFNQQRVI
jgi:hypothetical protein